jgi:hypothetical protein
MVDKRERNCCHLSYSYSNGPTATIATTTDAEQSR